MLVHDVLDRAEPGTDRQLRPNPRGLATGDRRNIPRTLLLTILDGGEALRCHVLLATANRARFGDCALYDDGYVLE
jgi:hypothetical protein